MSLSDHELRKFWEIANGLRKSLDAAEYKHIVLGLIFLKYVSDAFEDRRSELEVSFSDPKSGSYKANEKARANALEVRDYYKEVNVFWVPEKSRWSLISASSKQPELALMIDDALYGIEKENSKLEGIVERSYATSKLSVADLGAVVDLIGTIGFGKNRREASDVLGQVYEYFLGNFANVEGKLGGQFYTTPSIVKTLVEILQPTKGRVYDPACGSGGMFVQSERFVEAHGGKLGQISIYGQESNPTTRRLCAMNLAIRGIDFNLGKTHGDTFLENQHKDVRFDYIMMNPPFGMHASYPKAQLLDDVRWKKYGVPREKPANYAWLSHAVHHLAPKGRAGIVMPKGSLTSNQGGDDLIRKAMLDDDIIECIVDLPPKLFFNVVIPASLWFFNKDKKAFKNHRSREILFIDARKLGTPISKKQIEFSEMDIKKISDVYVSWRDGNYQDLEGFCKSVSRDEIETKSNSLLPSRYIGTAESTFDLGEDFQAILSSAGSELANFISDSPKLENQVAKILIDMGYQIFVDFAFRQTDSGVYVLSHTTPPEALEAIAKEIFRTWFVDFDFSKSINQGLERENSGSPLPADNDVALVDSELGQIPNDFQVKRIEDVAEVLLGGTPSKAKPEYWNGDIPWINSGAVNNFRITKGSESITDLGLQKSSAKILNPGATVIAITGATLGQYSRVEITTTANQSVIGLVAKDKIFEEYIYLWVTQNIQDLTAKASGGAQQHINRNDVREHSILVPTRRALESFSAKVKPIFDLISLATLSSQAFESMLEETNELQ
jgi:type I restriction enzyme M protein